MNEVDYFSDLQFGHYFDEIEKSLKGINEGRNLDCWPLGSFGWKDADLEPSGCTGIKRIVTLNDLSVTVEVGGHKTFCASEDADDDKEHAEQEIINDIGYPGNWDGDGWTIYTSSEVKVSWIMNDELGEPDYKATAEKIVKESKKAIAEFELTMREATKDFENLN